MSYNREPRILPKSLKLQTKTPIESKKSIPSIMNTFSTICSNDFEETQFNNSNPSKLYVIEEAKYDFETN